MSERLGSPPSQIDQGFECNGLVSTVIPLTLRTSASDSVATGSQLEVEIGVKHLQAGAFGSALACSRPSSQFRPKA